MVRRKNAELLPLSGAWLYSESSLSPLFSTPKTPMEQRGDKIPRMELRETKGDDVCLEWVWGMNENVGVFVVGPIVFVCKDNTKRRL